MSDGLEVLDGNLDALEEVWDRGMRDAYAFYHPRTSARVALAAALVESGIELQMLGGEAPKPPELLLGDLCLARASRLLAEAGDQRLQVGFARAVERVSAAAAGDSTETALRELLVAAIADTR